VGSAFETTRPVDYNTHASQLSQRLPASYLTETSAIGDALEVSG
jgi:hypothetical protein